MAEDIHFPKSSDGRIYVHWKIWGFLENMFLKKATSSYSPYTEVNSSPFSLFKSTWRIQAISSTYEQWLKVRLCRIHFGEDPYVSSAKTLGVPVSYRMEIETAVGDKIASEELEFANIDVGEWCKVFDSYDVSMFKKKLKYWEFTGIKDTAKIFCSFLLDPNNDVVELPLQMPSPEGTTSSSDSCKELYLCKSTMTSPEYFGDLYQSKGTLTSPEDLKELYLSKGTMTSSEYFEDKSIKDSMTLSENFKELYISKYFTDVILKVKDKEFRAHRIVLVARSNVFAAMFKHETSEKINGLVEISDCDPDTFEDFLLFLYSGKVDISSATNAVNLYKTSDKYDVKELKIECARCMTRELAADSFCDVVLLAANNNESELLSLAVDFFKANLEVILPTTKWHTFLEQFPLLCNELFIKTIKK